MDSILVLFIVCLMMSTTASIPDRNYYQSSNRRGRNNQNSGRRRGELIHDPDRVVFPDDLYNTERWTPPDRDKKIKNTTRNELPLGLATRLNELGDVNAFLEEFIENKEQYYSDNNIPETLLSLGSRFGTQNKSSKGGFSAKQVCSPVPTTIRLAPENHPSDVLYFPECAHVKRCSGCCNTRVLSCQPIKTSNVTFKIYESKFLPNKMKLRYNRSYNVEIEEHLSCGCRCRVQAHHCQSNQRYESGSCRCVCNDDLPSGKDECEAYGKIWDEFTCSCNCPEDVNTECTTQTDFDEEACACMNK